MPQSLNLTRNNLLGPRIDPSTEHGETPRRGLIASILLHVGIIAATLFTFSQAKLDIEDRSPPMVPVDLVTIAQKTNITPTVREQPKLEQIQVQPPSQDEMKLSVPALPQQAEVAPPPVQPKAEPLQKPLPAPVPKVRPQPEPKPEKSKKRTDEDLNALLNKLTAPSAAPKNARVASRTQRGFGAENAMTMELRDALKNQIEQCMDWGVVAGAPNAQNIVVSVDLTLNPDGTVARADPESSGGYDSYQRAASDAALRAIHVCAPYKLPADRYADWSESIVRFSPKDVLGQ